MIKLTINEQDLYDQAVGVCSRLAREEALLIEVLQKIEQTKLYKKFQRPSLFQFAVHELKLSEPVAYSFINVARKSREISSLRKAIQNGTLSVSKASRIVSALVPENAEALVQFAISHSCEKIDREVARINPKAGSRDKVKYLSENLVQVTITFSKEDFENLKRAEALAAQRGKKLSRGEVMGLSLSEHVNRHDPVKKAERALKKRSGVEFGRSENPASFEEKRTAPPKLCINRVLQSGRVKLTAEQKHAVFARDRGQCTHIGMNGERCTSDRFLHVHHVIPVGHGGSNDPENLVTLCSSHHDLVHQLSFPLENQVTWLRSPVVEYLMA